MGFTLIKGTFHVVGYSPDGDSIRFKANDNNNWVKINGNIKLNAKEHAQLRFQAIDTLETHYKRTHQPLEFALKAMNFLLDHLSIKNVSWDANMKKVISAEDGTPGFIFCREAEKYGRPIAFVYSGEIDIEDGSEIFLDNIRIKSSVNYQLLYEGLAYPTYYKGLFHDLREAFTEATKIARAGNKGFYPKDKTNSGFQVNSIQTISEEIVILPKLFRRLLAHLKEHDDLKNFIEILKKKRESILILNKEHFAYFDNIIEVTGNKVKLKEPIENIVFNA